MTVPLLYLITELSTGGAQTALLRLLERLDRRRFNPAVACLYNGDGHVAQAIRALDVPVFEAGLTRKSDLLALTGLYREIRRFQPAILHSHLFHANLPGRILGRLAGVPIILCTEHTSGMESEWRYRLNRLTHPLVDRTIAVSASVMEFCLRHIRLPAGKLVLIRNGVESPISLFLDKREARRSLGLPEGGPVIGNVGRLDPVKGQEVLIEALAQVEPAWLVLAGSGPDRPRLEALAQKLGVGERICWAGHQEDIYAVMAAFDVYVQPSLIEGLPVAVLEAMAAGLPVVATAVGGTTEAVIPEKTGLLVPPGSPQALVQSICRLLEDGELRRRLSQAGSERVKTDFSIAGTVRKTEELYSALLGAKGVKG